MQPGKLRFYCSSRVILDLLAWWFQRKQLSSLDRPPTNPKVQKKVCHTCRLSQHILLPPTCTSSKKTGSKPVCNDEVYVNIRITTWQRWCFHMWTRVQTVICCKHRKMDQLTGHAATRNCLCSFKFLHLHYSSAMLRYPSQLTRSEFFKHRCYAQWMCHRSVLDKIKKLSFLSLMQWIESGHPLSKNLPNYGR